VGGLLHSPFRLGPLQLRNRIVFAAHLTLAAADGLPTVQHAAYYGARAAGGTGLVITEEHSVLPADQPYEKLIRGGDRAALPGYRAISDAVHRYDVPVLAQLNHNGGQSSGMYSREPVWAPSPLADPMFREVPVEVTAREIDELVAGYARTAQLCVEGGFDGVELQCSHASILRQFLSPLTNRRTDGYGGSIERRSRIVREVAAAVRDAIGGRVLGVRLCGDEGLPGGTPVEEAVATARLLATDGTVTYLNTSVGVATSTLHMIEAPMAVPPGYALPVAAALRDTGLPTIGIGRFTTHATAEAALAGGYCDLVGVVRGQIADPAWAREPGTPCLGCNQECVGRVGRNQRLGCAVNPRAGRESIALPAPSRRRRVLVVGGGPAGLAAAAAAAGRGDEVVLCERADAVGGQLRLAASAPYREELGGIVRALHSACRRAGVEIRTGTVVDAAAIAAGVPDTVVLATGAVPVRPPWAGGLTRIVDVRDVLDGRVEPTGEVLVHDELGSHEATSVAEFLAARGCRVEVSTPALVVARYLGTTLDSELFHRRARSAGITMSDEQAVLSAAADGAGVRLEMLRHTRGTTVSRRYDWVVCAVPAAPANELWAALRGTGTSVERIGDCIAPRRMDAAIRDGERVGMRR
jgi:2,4-dienoyl-CoA reductase (NADPH2)